VVSYSLVSLRVSILLASTSGWLKVLMPMTEPAVAVAISQRKNSWPTSNLVPRDDADDGMPGFFESGDGRGPWPGCFPWRGADRRRRDRCRRLLACRFFSRSTGMMPLPTFTGGFGDELFEPGAEIGDAGGSENGDFVAALIGGDAENGA